MRLLVCGSRTFDDVTIVHRLLNGIYADTWPDGFSIIEGECHLGGADILARDWAEAKCLPVEKFPADWDRHGKAAGPIRNQRMLEEGKPDIVVAFIDKPLQTSRGTADMVRRARQAGLPVYIIEAFEVG